MIEFITTYWHWIAVFYFFSVVKSQTDTADHDYKNFKSRWGIPDKWDWWFNPAISWKNKYKSWLWKTLTPVSDFWHSAYTLWQISFLAALWKQTGNLVYTVLLAGVPAVYLIFNGLLAFMRRKKFIEL